MSHKHPAYILIFLLCASYWGGALAVDERNSDQVERSLKQLQQRIDRLQQQLEAKRNRHDALQLELRDSDRRIAKLSRRLQGLSKEMQTQQTRLTELRQQRREKEASLGQNREELAEQIRATYVTGRQAYLKMLLNMQDPQMVGRMLVYYDYYNQARAKRVSTLKENLLSLDQLSTEIETALAQRKRLRQRQETEKLALADSQAQRKQVVTALKKEIRHADSELTELKHNEQRLQGLLQELGEVVDLIPPAPTSKQLPFMNYRGRLDWPVKGKVLARYGSRRGAEMRWKGMLIAADAGKQVRAVSHGRVIFADWLRGYGLMIIIDHGGGYMSLYGHNESLHKATGEWVSAQEIISTAGRSGGQERTAVYFELRHKGEPQNPARWLRRKP